jgi:hypothetical protein
MVLSAEKNNNLEQNKRFFINYLNWNIINHKQSGGAQKEAI